jgi:hypothetical protein
VQDLIDSFTQSSEDAGKRRKAASAKQEIYKVKFSDGEKHAYEDAAKKLKFPAPACNQYKDQAAP